MAVIIRTEKRVCPFCDFKYIRKVYATDRGRGSICPQCHKRSDKCTTRIGKWKAPTLKVCENQYCDKTFYSNGSQKYCVACGHEKRLMNVRVAVKRFRAKKKLSSEQNES